MRSRHSTAKAAAVEEGERRHRPHHRLKTPHSTPGVVLNPSLQPPPAPQQTQRLSLLLPLPSQPRVPAVPAPSAPVRVASRAPGGAAGIASTPHHYSCSNNRI